MARTSNWEGTGDDGKGKAFEHLLIGDLLSNLF